MSCRHQPAGRAAAALPWYIRNVEGIVDLDTEIGRQPFERARRDATLRPPIGQVAGQGSVDRKAGSIARRPANSRRFGI
jgi:hypothetical protein